eukprot:symbB.v1.2.001814.t1/scaffold97.1/size333048/18
MAPSVVAPIGAAWLEQNGGGHVNGEQREVLAKVLTTELETKGFPKTTVEKEVGEFLDHGRVSATNLDRLARRVQCSSVKLKPKDMSARASPKLDRQEAPATPDIHELARWSVVAAIEKQRMEDEKQEQHLVDRERKSRYREFLKGQVEERLKEKVKANEEKVVVRALADKDREKEMATTQTRQEKMIRLKDDILSQVSARQSRKQEEKCSDLEQAQKENQRAIRLMEEEKVEIAKKKEIRRVMDQTQAQAWAEQRQRGLDQRRREAQQRATDKQRRDEAAEILRRENQELLEQAKTERSLFFERLHLRKDVARTDRLKQRNERIQQELQELAPIRSAADRQEEEERRKDEVHRRKRRENVEFLQKQMEEKEERQRRDQEFEQKKLQEHKDLAMKQAERDLRKQEDMQKRRSRYKTELLDQLAAKKAARSCGFKVKEDFMSDMEISLNKEMLGELSVYVESPRSVGHGLNETY